MIANLLGGTDGSEFVTANIGGSRASAFGVDGFLNPGVEALAPFNESSFKIGHPDSGFAETLSKDIPGLGLSSSGFAAKPYDRNAIEEELMNLENLIKEAAKEEAELMDQYDHPFRRGANEGAVYDDFIENSVRTGGMEFPIELRDWNSAKERLEMLREEYEKLKEELDMRPQVYAPGFTL